MAIAKKLRLNVIKTEYLLVCSNHKVAQLTFPLLGDDQIKRFKSAKSLAVYIDAHILWSNQISSGIAGLKQVTPFVQTEVLIKIIKLLVLSSFDYCDVVWSGLNKGLSERIDRLYNQAARIITHSDWETNILTMLQWDTLRVRHQHHIAIILHKIMHNKFPEFPGEAIILIRDNNMMLTI